MTTMPTVTFTGSSTVTVAAPSIGLYVQAALTPHSTVTATAAMTMAVTTAIAAHTALAANPVVDKGASAGVAAHSAMSVTGQVIPGVGATITGAGTLAAAAVLIIRGTAAIAAHAAFSGTPPGTTIDAAVAISAVSGCTAAGASYVLNAAASIHVGSYLQSDADSGPTRDLAASLFIRSVLRATGALHTPVPLEIDESGAVVTMILRRALRLPSPFAPEDLDLSLDMDLLLTPGPVDFGNTFTSPQPVLYLDVVIPATYVPVELPLAAGAGATPTPATVLLWSADRHPALRFSFTRDGRSYPITGCTILFILRKEGLTLPVFTGEQAQVAILSGTGGVAQFDWPRALTDPGDYVAVCQVIDPAGRIQHTPPLTINLQRSL